MDDQRPCPAEKETKMIEMGRNKRRRTCKRCELSRWILWLTVCSLVVEVVDDIATFVRIIIE